MLGYTDDEGGHYSCFGRYATKSVAAARREDAARAEFTKALTQTPIQGEAARVQDLLPPSVHLTSDCWTDFSKWVRTHPGCKATRRIATEIEKRAHRQTRKGPCYWVDVVISAEAQAQALGGERLPVPPCAIKEENGCGHPPAGGKRKVMPCAVAAERKVSGPWATPEEARLRQLVDELGESAWEEVASRLGTGRSGSAVQYHWREARKKRKIADDLEARMREEANEEHAEASIALDLAWPPVAGAAAAVAPANVTDLTLTAQYSYSDETLLPTPLPPLPPLLRKLRLVRAAKHLSDEGWAAIASCETLLELKIQSGGTELDRLQVPPPNLRVLHLSWVPYQARPPPAFFERLGARRALRTLWVSGSCELPAACLHALRSCPLRTLVLLGSRDDGSALARPHSAALPALVALAPGLRRLELTGTDLTKREASALNDLLPPGCKSTFPPKKDFEPLDEWADRLEAAEQAGGPLSGRFSPIYDKYGYSSWGTYSRRHDYSRSTHHREEHGRYGLEPFDQSFPNFEEEW